MKLDKLIANLLLITIFSTSCDREMLGERTVIIENSLDMEVRLKFYNRGVPLEITNFTSDGPGKMFEKSLTLQGGVEVSDVLYADSILIIFNGLDFERHSTENQPRGNSLFNSSSYQRQSENVVLYTIDEKNLANAVPCQGNCQ